MFCDCNTTTMCGRIIANNLRLIPSNRFVCALIVSGVFNVILILVIINFDNYVPLDNSYLYNRSNWKHFSEEEIRTMSTLGRVLFLGETAPQPTPNKTYTILLWKYGHTIENRHIKHFTDKEFDPFDMCSVKNCKLSYEDADIKFADILVFHMQRMEGIQDLPDSRLRNPKQIWAFLTDESPIHTWMHRQNKWRHYNNYFNWSMTYSYRSDIPVPNGRTIARSKPNDSYADDSETWNRKRLAAILLSHCDEPYSQRLSYTKELQKYMSVDFYGKCGNLTCPGRYDTNCEPLNKYKFYLAFENSNCEEYMTEKLYWNAYSKNSIPIIMGASESSLAKLLPPLSYINVEHFSGPRDLANYVLHLVENSEEFQTYFEWKKYFILTQEHGYYKTVSYHYCRVCEALNFNSKEPKVYSDLEAFWSEKSCRNTHYYI